MTELLKALSVRILNAQEEAVGSGFLYIHDEKHVFVLTAAHVLDSLTDQDTFFAECQPGKGNETVISYRLPFKRADVYSKYGPGEFPTDDWKTDDAAVIRLRDTEGCQWLAKRRCEVSFVRPGTDLSKRKVTGYGYPGYTAKTKMYLAQVEADPDVATCESHIVSTKEIRWDLGLNTTDARNKKEYEGWSGCILALAGQQTIILAGIVLCVYKQNAGREFLGADLTQIRELLNRAGVTVREKAASSGNELADEQRLIDRILQACNEMHNNRQYASARELQRNIYIRDVLRHSGYIVHDQSMAGVSASGKGPGVLDFDIRYSVNQQWTICEALRINGCSPSHWNDHLSKLLDNYNPHGLPFVILLSYVDVRKERFYKVLDFYGQHIRSFNPEPFAYVENSYERENMMVLPDGFSFCVSRCQYRRGSYTPTVYHIFVGMGE